MPLGLRSNAPETVAISRAIMSIAAPVPATSQARLGLALFRTVRRQTAPWPVALPKKKRPIVTPAARISPRVIFCWRGSTERRRVRAGMRH